MIPSIGRIVHYTLTESDAAAINRRRYGGGSTGNSVRAGEVYPLMITRVWSDTPDENTCVNGQVLLDGNDSHWVTSVQQGEGERQWREPRRV